MGRFSDYEVASEVATGDRFLILDKSDTQQSDDGSTRGLDYLTLKNTIVESISTITALTPENYGAVGDGESHPLSDYYSSLAEAQAVYPHATALTDEIDWAAWQALADYLYDRDNGDVSITLNWACGYVLAAGMYVVNKTITFNMAALKIVGETPGHRVATRGSQCGFIYNGDDGTVDQPTWILDLWLFDENGDPPSGRKDNTVLSGGGKYEIEGMTFYGKGGSMTGLTGTESGYISGVRIRKSSFSKISNCNFGGTLWDGINTTDAQLFFWAERNFFYGCYRDGIAIHKGGSTFSTTCWIYNNEFGYCGRYLLFMDFRGSIDSDPRVRDNSFELGNNNFFPSDSDWWVHGVVSPVCVIESKNGIFDGNRYESITDAYTYYWADLHLVDSLRTRVVGGVCRNIFLSSNQNTSDVNAAMTSYVSTYGYRDITNTRNYNCGESGDNRNGNQALRIDGVGGLNKIITADNVGFGTSYLHAFKDIELFFSLSVDVVAGTYAKKIGDRPSAYTQIENVPAFVAENVTIVDERGRRTYLAGGPSNGRFIAKPSAVSDWQATTAYTVDVAGLNVQNAVKPTTYNGYIYQCSVAGTSGGSEPTWPTVIGDTVVDGTVTWTCVATAYDSNDVGANGLKVTIENGEERRVRNAAPTAGRHNRGDIVYHSAPTAGGTIGWVCTTAGEPGTWKTFGTIAS